jgi:hypothetical protein
VELLKFNDEIMHLIKLMLKLEVEVTKYYEMKMVYEEQRKN